MADKTSRLNLVDRLVSWVSPAAGVRRAHARSVLSYYEAAKSDRLRKGRRATGSGNDEVKAAGASLRQIARHLEENYDLALGVLNTLVANVVGPNGIGVEPQPRKADGTIDDDLARVILELWKDWCRAPEVTKQHDWPSTQRLLARSWLRDGEVFSQMISGMTPQLNHGTTVPFSIEMLEADYVPMELSASAPAEIVQGIELNAWGAPTGYHVFKTSPLEGSALVAGRNTKRIPAERMLHIKNVHRIRQLRGVSVFASVLTRFDDLKDYEESERIAAKIAASMAAYIKKGAPELYDPSGTDEGQRLMKFRPGMVFDDLRPGEDIGMIDTNRPNPNLETYRGGQLKAIAAGAGPTYSSIARSYDGTYSAQRQELVEGYAIYATLANEFIGRIVRPIYEQFIATAIASGKLAIPQGVKLETLDDATYMPPAMPWIDPKKEAEAWGMLEDRAYASGPEIIRKRGGNPIDVLEQQARWRREKADNGIPTNQATEPLPVDPQETQARLNLTRAQALLVAAQEKAEQARSEHAKQMAQAVVTQAKLAGDAAMAEIAERKAHTAAAEARKKTHEALAALNAADAEIRQRKFELDAAEASARMSHSEAEHQARLDALREEVARAEAASEEKVRLLGEAADRERELHAIRADEMRKRASIAAVDLQAAEIALAELERGE